MNSNANSTSAPKGIEVNIVFLLEKVLKKWWALLLAAILSAGAGFALAAVTTDNTYSTNLSFTTYNKEASDVVSSSDINSSIMMTNTFKYILQGRTMRERVAESCSFDITADQIALCMSVETQADTNVIIVRVKTESAEKSYEIARNIAKHYQDIVDYAYPNAMLQMYEEPFFPAAPDAQTTNMRYSIIGAIVGFVIAFAAIMISNAVNDTVQTAEDIQFKLDSNIVGTIAAVHNKGRKSKTKNLLITDRTLGFSFIEAYKAIRTKVETFCSRKGYKVILVTSASENEGKTTFALNLALSLAQNGKSVLLIDADMRKPAVNKFLGLNVGRGIDLASVICGKTELSDAIKFVEKYKLFILTTNEVNDEPTEILSSQQMNKLIKAARKEFDYVILDTAPAAVVTDANILSNFADCAILVIRENFAACARIRSVIDDIGSNKAELIGCVYNNVASSGIRGAYGKYKYGYSYGYGYGDSLGYGYGYGGSSAGEEPNEKIGIEHERGKNQ